MKVIESGPGKEFKHEDQKFQIRLREEKLFCQEANININFVGFSLFVILSSMKRVLPISLFKAEVLSDPYV